MANHKLQKTTRTSKYLLERTRSTNFTGERDLGVRVDAKGYVQVPRLSYYVTSKRTADWERVAADIDMHRRGGALCFLDTSVFDCETDARVWEALLRKHTGSYVVVLTDVLEELGPWMDRHPEHVATRALQREDSSLVILDPTAALSKSRAFAADYYVTLLLLRKRIIALREHEFQAINGRPPHRTEQDVIRLRIERELGARGLLLASKGERDAGKPNFSTDEVLVYFSTILSLEASRPMLLLTKDEDLQEQFYKLTWTLEKDYRAMLLAGEFADHRSRLKSRVSSPKAEGLQEEFDGSKLTVIERTEEDLLRQLPVNHTRVPLQCMVLGRYVTDMSFAAEYEMNQIVETKGATSGLNTDRFAGRNCHFVADGTHQAVRLGGFSLIGKDHLLVRNSSMRLSLMAAKQALFTREWHFGISVGR